MTTTPNRKQRRAAQRGKPDREYETLQHASARIDLSVWALRDRIARGELPAYRTSDKPGAAIRVRCADVDAMMRPVIPAKVYGR